jgi:hypothetical protein
MIITSLLFAARTLPHWRLSSLQEIIVSRMIIEEALPVSILVLTSSAKEFVILTDVSWIKVLKIQSTAATAKICANEEIKVVRLLEQRSL